MNIKPPAKAVMNGTRYKKLMNDDNALLRNHSPPLCSESGGEQIYIRRAFPTVARSPIRRNMSQSVMRDSRPITSRMIDFRTRSSGADVLGLKVACLKILFTT